VWVQTSKVPLTDSRGNVMGVMGCYADITERKRTEAALERTLGELEDRVRERTADLSAANARLTDEVEQRRATETRLRLFRSLLDRANDGLFINDATGRFVDVNRAACESLGYTREELLALSVWDVEELFDGPEAWRTTLERLAAQPPTVVEGGHRRKDGSVFPVEVNVAHITEDGRSYVVAVVRDISWRKTEEAELRTAKEEAERASRAKTEFLSRISHELRTPMNAILGFAQLLQESGGEPPGAGQQRFTGEYTREILAAGNHLLTLVNEILDLTRIEAGMLDLEITSVPVAAAVAEAAGFLAPMALERNVTVEDETGEPGGLWVLADPMRLREVLLNLVSNAIKYNREGGKVTLSCRSLPGERVAVTVDDTGPGIAPEQRERLFEPFDRLGMETTGVEGTGVGLAITRQLATAMRGTVELESEPGAGSRFIVVLPAGEPAPEAPAPEPPRPALERQSGGPRTVLYIEDNPTNMTLVEEIFRGRPDMVLLSANRGRTGLDTAREQTPDLILLDVNLPDMDGFEVLEALRDDDATREIPVVGVSANSFAEDVARARQAGFTDYVTKPFNVGAFLATVDGALARGGPGWRGGSGPV
jgi:PAS domain S-box-containing protein